MKFQAVAIVNGQLKLARLARDTREDALADARDLQDLYCPGMAAPPFKAITVECVSSDDRESATVCDVWAGTSTGYSRIVIDGKSA